MIHWILLAGITFNASDNQVRTPEPVAPATQKFYVFDRRTKAPLEGVEVSIIYKDTCRTKVTSSAQGLAECPALPIGKYRIEYRKAREEGRSVYLTMTTTVNIPTQKQADTVWMEKVTCTGGCIRIENAYFDAGSDAIRHDASLELDNMVTNLKNNPTLEIEINGHSDCLGSAAGNMQMSIRRAQNVQAYFISKGISKSRLTLNAYGDTRQVNACDREYAKRCTPEMLQQNRRVEFKVLKF